LSFLGAKLTEGDVLLQGNDQLNQGYVSKRYVQLNRIQTTS